MASLSFTSTIAGWADAVAILSRPLIAISDRCNSPISLRRSIRCWRSIRSWTKTGSGWWGWSWGGTFTLNALTHSDRFRAGVSVAPVTDWRNYDSIYTERYMGTPAENPDGYRDDSEVNSAEKLHGRLLLAHGTGDDNVHIANSIQFIQRLIDAGIPYDFQVYPRKTHSIAGPEARTHLFNRILAHFEAYLKNAPESK